MLVCQFARPVTVRRVARLMQLHFQRDTLYDLALMVDIHLCDRAMSISNTGNNLPYVSWGCCTWKSNCARFVPTLHHHGFMTSWFCSARSTTDWSWNYWDWKPWISNAYTYCQENFLRIQHRNLAQQQTTGRKRFADKKSELHSSSPATISWKHYCTINRLIVLAVGHGLIWIHPFHSSYTINRYIPK